MQIIAKRRQRYTRTDRQRLEKVNEPMFFSSIAMPQHGWKQKSVSIKWKANSRVSEQKKKSQRHYIYLCGYNNCCLLERTDFNNPLSHSIRFDSIITLEKCSAILLERCRCASSLHSNGAAVVFFFFAEAKCSISRCLKIVHMYRYQSYDVYNEPLGSLRWMKNSCSHVVGLEHASRAHDTCIMEI